MPPNLKNTDGVMVKVYILLQHTYFIVYFTSTYITFQMNKALYAYNSHWIDFA
jgi:hypothetical protein